MALSPQITEVIFTKLLLTYGKRFTDTYGEQDLSLVRGHWQHELAGVSEHSVRYALDNLPRDWPPNVLQFRELCRQAPQPMRQAITPPRGSRMPPGVKEQLQALVERMRNSGLRDPLVGARSLREKERNGILLTRAQREFWRIALAAEMREESLAKEPPL